MRQLEWKSGSSRYSNAQHSRIVLAFQHIPVFTAAIYWKTMPKSYEGPHYALVINGKELEGLYKDWDEAKKQAQDIFNVMVKVLNKTE